MRRKTARPYGQSVSSMRLVSMLMATLVLWMLYDRLKDPATWRLIADDKPAKASVETDNGKSPEPENIVPGPNDQDQDEVAAAQDQLEAIDDRAPLKQREMGAYWRLMNWSRTEPFNQLENRAKDDVPFTQLWEQPEKYRGQLIRLRMHVRRVLEYDAPENTYGIAKVYEAWGWTEESRSFPYVVVFPEAPPDLPIGTDVRAEIVFVGYFMKIMSYKAFDNPRGAPLLIGRATMVSSPIPEPPSKLDPWIIPLIVIAATAFIGITALMGIRSRGKSKVRMLPNELSVANSWSVPDSDNPFGRIDAVQPAVAASAPPEAVGAVPEVSASPSSTTTSSPSEIDNH